MGKFVVTRLELFRFGHLKSRRLPKPKGHGPWILAEEFKPLIEKLTVKEIELLGLDPRQIYRIKHENKWVSFWIADRILTKIGLEHELNFLNVHEHKDRNNDKTDL